MRRLAAIIGVSLTLAACGASDPDEYKVRTFVNPTTGAEMACLIDPSGGVETDSCVPVWGP